MRIKMGHTAVSDIESSSLTLKTRQKSQRHTVNLLFLQDSRRKDRYKPNLDQNFKSV